jgi:hypothetical protein
MGKYLEVLNEIKAEFGDNWIFPAAETVLKLARREYRDNTLINTEFEDIQARALELMRPYITKKYADKPTNYGMIKTTEDLATVLVDQKYCESCLYNRDGLCAFDADKESINMYMACYNAAVAWLQEGAE